MSIIIQENQVYAELPGAVEKELEVLRSCPPNVKPKEFFFEELKSLILRLRKTVNSVIVAGRSMASCDASNKPIIDEVDDVSPVSIISSVLKSTLPRMFGTDPNSEAVKYSNLANPKPGISEFIQLIVEVFSNLSDDGKSNHLLHAILNNTKIQKSAGVGTQFVEEPITGENGNVATPTTPPPRNGGANVMSALWSYKRSPLFRAFSVSAEDQDWGKKILGGIPKSAANVTVPAVSGHLMRNWSQVANGDIRFVLTASELAGIDFACQNCGACKNLDWVLENFFTNTVGGLLHVACIQCNHPVYVTLLPTSHRPGVKLECLGSILDSVLDLPITFATYLNLHFLMGLNVEVYTRGDDSRRELRGVISLIEVLVDFASLKEQEVNHQEQTKVEGENLVLEEKGDEVKPDDGLMTPRSRARMRIREYRKKQRTKPSPVAVIRINVDRSVSPPPGKPGSLAPFRRRLSGGTNSQKSSPQSPPAPPSERRPAESAPRRIHRKSSEFFKP